MKTGFPPTWMACYIIGVEYQTLRASSTNLGALGIYFSHLNSQARETESVTHTLQEALGACKHEPNEGKVLGV